MRILSVEKAHAWLKDRSIGVNAEGIPVNDCRDRLLFLVPALSTNLLSLAHRLANGLEYGQTLLWMSHWAPREPDEMDAFLQIRKRYQFLMGTTVKVVEIGRVDRRRTGWPDGKRKYPGSPDPSPSAFGSGY